MNKNTFLKFALIPILLVGCATPQPPAPGSAASKLVFLSDLSDIALGDLRALRPIPANDFLTVEAEFINTSSSYTSFQYRFQWRDRNGMEMGNEENWKVLNFSPTQAQRIKAVATSKKATDFKIELKENH